VAVHFLHDAFDPEGLAVEVHLLAVGCRNKLARQVSNEESPLLSKTGWMALLNLIWSALGSAEDLGSSCVVIVMPCFRQFGGRRDKKSRGALALAEKGLNLVVTFVMKRVIIVFSFCPAGGAEGKL